MTFAIFSLPRLFLKAFFEGLKPFGDLSEKEINDSLYDGSLLIEPRGSKQAPKFVSDTSSTLLMNSYAVSL